MTSTTTPTPELSSVLTGAASLLAAAALLDTTDNTAPVSVTVSGPEISVQVCQHAGPAARRVAAVAAYARILHTELVHRPSPEGPHSWAETRGQVGGHPVHVWTLIHRYEQEA